MTPTHEPVPPAVAEIRDRHLSFYADLLDAATTGLRADHATSVDVTSLQAQARSELDNVRAALGWALTGGPVEVGLALYAVSSPVWSGAAHEGRTWGERLLASGAGSDHARARCLLVLADLLRRLGESLIGVQRLREALRHADRSGDPALQAEVLLYLAGARMFDASAECVELYERALELLATVPDAPAWQVAECLRGVAWGKMLLGDHSDRDRSFDEARAVLEQSGARHSVAAHLGIQANLLLWYGDHVAERRCREEALEILQEEGFVDQHAWFSLSLAEQDLNEDKLDDAERRFSEAFAHVKGKPPADSTAARAVAGLAAVAMRRGDEVRARTLIADSIRRFGEIETGLEAALPLDALRLASALARSAGHIEESRRLTVECIQMSTKLNAVAYTAGDLREQAARELDIGNQAEAVELLERAAGLFPAEPSGSVLTFASAATRAELALERDGPAEAERMVEQALAASATWSPVHRAGLRVQLARVLQLGGEQAKARALFEEVLASGVVPHGVTTRATAYLGIATSAALLGDADGTHQALTDLGHRWRVFPGPRLRCELIEVLAWSSAEHGRASEAAELLGAAAAYRTLTRTGQRDVLRPIAERAAEKARAADAEEFEDAFARGGGRWRELLTTLLG